ncbi:ABC transporter permease, partial [Escherichia coli]|nr:ABC transporter permease [Escherichia coli]
MVISPFLFLGISGGIAYLQGSSMAKNDKVAVVTTVPSVAEGLKNVNGVNFDYKDEASAKEAIKDEKLKGYLTIDQEDSVLKAVY